jgi:geranylgeranyl diphosphate synthase type I
VNFSATADLKEIRNSINQELLNFVAGENKYLNEIGSELAPVATAMERFLLDSGKRLRPLFAYLGFLGTGSKPSIEILRACASLELVHVCALMHDDVMDASDTRRGAPSIHRAFEAMHVEEKLSGSAAQFGISSAILLGDLALVWSAKMLHQSGIDGATLLRSLPMYDEMRVELMAGQYLDVYEQALASVSVERSLKVARYKSGKYTIERPLHFGAALGDGKPNLFTTYSNYGLPLGEAFQLRDDILGIFGDPQETGKPAGDDLREGKRTVLLAKVMELADSTQKSEISSTLGNQGLDLAQVNKVREIFVSTGALSEVEALISKLTSSAQSALEHGEIDPMATSALTQLLTIVTQRKL